MSKYYNLKSFVIGDCQGNMMKVRIKGVEYKEYVTDTGKAKT
jgi:hypothetical protein